MQSLPSLFVFAAGPEPADSLLSHDPKTFHILQVAHRAGPVHIGNKPFRIPFSTVTPRMAETRVRNVELRFQGVRRAAIPGCYPRTFLDKRGKVTYNEEAHILTARTYLTMRYVWLLILISVAALLPLQEARAQDIAFSGTEIISLAKAIVAETSTSHQLPSSFQMTMVNGHTMVVTASNAFELLCRAIIAWRETTNFPGEVAIEMHNLKGPKYNEQDEPRTPGLLIAVPSVDIGTYAEPWLKVAAARGNTIPSMFTFESKQKMTPAQFIVGISTLIDETLKNKAMPVAIAMPMVRSPQDWLNTYKPLVVASKAEEANDTITDVEIALSISLNGMELTEAGPVLPNFKGPVPPFCGPIHIEMQGYGPVGDIHLLLDNTLLNDYRGIGPHHYELNTLPLADGLHTIAATATNSSGKTYAYIFSFMVQNGRRTGFTPAQISDATLEARVPKLKSLAGWMGG